MSTLWFHSNCALKLLRPALLKPLLDGFVQVSLIALSARMYSFLVNDAGGDRLRVPSHRLYDAPSNF